MSLELHNPDHKAEIQETLKQGIKSPFWQIVKKRLQEHIDSVQALLDSDHLKDKPAEQYKTETEVLKRQKSDRIGIIDMPEVLLAELDDPDFFERKEDEIYSQAEDFAPENK